jgi:hypothetical protein
VRAAARPAAAAQGTPLSRQEGAERDTRRQLASRSTRRHSASPSKHAP